MVNLRKFRKKYETLMGMEKQRIILSFLAPKQGFGDNF